MRSDIVLPIIIIGAVILIFTTITMVIIRSAKRQRQKKEIERDSMTQSETIPGGASGENTYEGITYYYKHFKGTDKAPPYFSITIPCTSAGAFTITPESKFDRFFKKLGVSVEIQTYDPTFDDAFYINTAYIPFTRSCMEKTENRRSIQAMFDHGFNHLKHDGKSIILTWRNFPRKQLMEVRTMEKAAAQLALLGRSLPKITSYETPEPSTWKYKRLFAFALPVLLLVTGIIALIIGISNHKPLDMGRVVLHSLKFSLPLLVLFTWLSLHLLKGRSSSHRELIAVFLISLFAFPLAAIGYDTFLNGALDDGPPAVHQVMVIKKYYTKKKSNFSYYAIVQSWREKSGEKLKISRRFYDYLNPGSSRITITTKPGKFGFEWIVEFH
jgi:hypothetical protein